MAKLVIDVSAIEGLGRKWRKAGAKGREQILDDISGLLETQLTERIEDTKASPEGVPWKKWSADYARTRKAHHSLGISTGNMRDDVFAQPFGATAIEAGTVRNYAAAFNETRPFLGISRENKREIEDTLTAVLQGLL